ncbi:similar to Saccharomyces cerevisiae YGR255C COQ6 Putative flavin-dependent monooxygenase [Maudiozyma saulgeensis]|uniref:Ubiquinone biosynthesis monooxygenase COQ6, mitochondrial n=1 Tax=Maudiozyma saulgeensis TaxID=1789683 RepID=A0A1X7QXA6_9SACH|nr:similar to Saccharomyces cerevisiae YGR255C COQ6 Putative flavin-dependent monooxygenase [Kazachstania saulgeensis]
MMFLGSFQTVIRRQLATAAKSAGPKLTDVLIVGGGPAGLTLATAIKTSPILSGFKTTLVDSQNLTERVAKFYDNPPEEFTNRVVSLTPKSKKFLTETLGVQLMHERIQSYDGLYVIDGMTDARMALDQDGMLDMIEILNIQASLLHRLNHLNLGEDSFEIKEEVKVTSIESSTKGDPTSWPIVTLSNGEQYKTRLLVGADGFNSPVKKFSGITTRGWPYDTFGMVATLKLNPLSPFAKLRGWQRFLKTGPIAHLPLPGDNATLVWSTKGNKMSQLLLQLDPKVFSALVNAAFVLDDADLDYYYKILEENPNEPVTNESVIEDINQRINQVWDSLKNDSLIDERYPPQVLDIVAGTRARFPLKLSHADTYCSDRIALVGDAAHTTHPLAGQGLNMGQHDVEELTKALEKGTLRGLDIGSLLCLEPFWGECYSFNNVRLGMADKLHKIYGTDFTPVVQLRSLGLQLTDSLGPVKDLLINTLTAGSSK